MTAGDVRVRACSHDYISGIVLNGADDYLQIDAVAAAEALASNTMGTISAWINVPDQTGTYSIFSLGDDNADEILWLGVEAGTIIAQNTDGGVAQWDINSTNKVIIPHQWHHVVLVQDGVRPRIYVDGALVAMTDTVTTDLTEWTNGLTGVDKGAIGVNDYNNVMTQDFLGCIAYVKYSTGTTYASAWTAEQVLAEYKYRAGVAKTSAGTDSNYCTWTLDNTLVESQTGGATYDATIVSDAQFDVQYSELTSRLRNNSAVVADDITMVYTGGKGVLYTLIKAA
jgi:hypothetical protein